ENFHGYFDGELPEGHAEAQNYERYGVPDSSYDWAKFYDRYDLSKEPNEPNRFGWIVEVDVMDPNSTPKKRTALGRTKHEGAESIVASAGGMVCYVVQCERFGYCYQFVTEGAFSADGRAATIDLRNSGTLYVALFNEDGTMGWLPMVQGEGPLTVENGFACH